MRKPCSLWVISGHMRCNKRRPLYPNSDRESGFPAKDHVCFTPESGHVQCKSRCPLSANSGLMQCSNWDRYSITSSVIRRNSRVIVSPSSFAVFKLMTSSNLVGCSTGSSEGLAPLRILSTNGAAARNKSAKFAP